MRTKIQLFPLALFLFMYLNKYSLARFLWFFFLLLFLFLSALICYPHCLCSKLWWFEILLVGNNILFFGDAHEMQAMRNKTKNWFEFVKKEEKENVETRRKTFFWLINNLNVDNFSHKYLYCKYCCINMLRANRRVQFCCCSCCCRPNWSNSIESFTKAVSAVLFYAVPTFRVAFILTFWVFRLSVCSSVAWDFPLGGHFSLLLLCWHKKT